MEEWFKSEEKLPRIGDTVLGIEGNKSFPKYQVCYLYDGSKNTWYPEDDNGAYSFLPELDITHWMYLPKFELNDEEEIE